MVLYTSDLNNIARCVPTLETPPSPLAPVAAIEMVYDVYITKDPTGRSLQAYIIDIPGEMNYEDPTFSRRKRMFHIVPMWYLQNEKSATWAVMNGRLPNTMQLGKRYGYILTDDYEINRPHIYHPEDTTLAYPFNMGTNEEDDKSKNVKPSRWDGIKEALRRFLTNKWVQRLAFSFLFGAIFAWIWQETVGPLAGACSFAIISRTAITCPDGLPGERILYRANNCSLHTYDGCTGEDTETAPPPKAGENILMIGVGIAVLFLGIAGAYVLVSREKKKPAPPPPPPQAPPETKGGLGK